MSANQKHLMIRQKKSTLLILRKSGCSTEGEIDSVRLVGPSAPATYRFLPETNPVNN